MNKNEITLVIFPFVNLSEGDSSRLFCEAFTIDLVTELSRFRQFNIITYHSASNPGALTTAGEEVAKAAPADYFIKGTFRSNNERLLVNAQLINTKDSQLIWADRFEGNAECLLSIQEDLLRQIVSTLQQQLNYDLITHLRKKPALQLRTYEYWLRGMEELKKGTLQADLEARQYFQAAIESDPKYSLAYSGISLTYFNEWSCQLWDRWEVSKNGAYEWAKKAIELDDQNYVAAFVLGRTKLYSGEYEIAEHYLRRALRLNPNDPESVVLIASCFVFLGFFKEAEVLYHKVLRLNPLNEADYFCFGTLVYFETGNFKKAVDLAQKVTSPQWVDFYALVAAVHFHSGDYKQMHHAWQQYLTDFSNKIAMDKARDEHKALQWMKDVNPYKDKTKMKAFWDYIGAGNVGHSITISAPPKKETGQMHLFQKESGLWLCCYDDHSVRISDSKGFNDLAKLISVPNHPIHCSELMGSSLSAEKEQLFDEKAKKNYRKKILELQQELSEAENNNDHVKANKIQQEYDALLNYLSKSLGLQGKVRHTNNPVEKARTAVTWRIRKAIQKIEQSHPALGKHFAVSVKTGTFCTYNPERPTSWQV
jgi:TolB-like protein/Tfp pilus assembly protein PilF